MMLRYEQSRGNGNISEMVLENLAMKRAGNEVDLWWEIQNQGREGRVHVSVLTQRILGYE